eukprot:234425-Prymnesium_polylepis.2
MCPAAPRAPCRRRTARLCAASYGSADTESIRSQCAGAAGPTSHLCMTFRPDIDHEARVHSGKPLRSRWV